MAHIIDGKFIARNIRLHIGQAVCDLKTQHNLIPGLAVVLVGDDPASKVYVANKAKQTTEVGMNSWEHRLASHTDENILLSLIQQLNQDPAVHGILVQLPLPAQIKSSKILNSITPEKDVDGFHIMNVGRLAIGQEALVPCTPLGVLMLAKHSLGKLSGLEAVIIGRSNIVGKPLAQLLLTENCTVTIAHSHTKDLPLITKRADLLIAAAGRPGMVKGSWIKPGACVIDVGINQILRNGKRQLVGDCDYADCAAIAGAITPVPGGVGPMTIACLLLNTLRAACLQHDITPPKIDP